MSFVSKSCVGEFCFCGEPATHKLAETIMWDDPQPSRHPLTTYICQDHFRQIMGPAAEFGPTPNLYPVGCGVHPWYKTTCLSCFETDRNTRVEKAKYHAMDNTK